MLPRKRADLPGYWDYATMTRRNDYSFNASDASFTTNPHIIVYYDGRLVYGTEP
ncbi:hypothetical protein [Actinospica robiniae]|uniref:hypothetical protein n=1 Tax=Actinospica robiniae TaxID=304901 RepID=UPI000403AB9C|nr:hypothetical protein [Actinospica robiniae]